MFKLNHYKKELLSCVIVLVLIIKNHALTTYGEVREEFHHCLYRH